MSRGLPVGQAVRRALWLCSRAGPRAVARAHLAWSPSGLAVAAAIAVAVDGTFGSRLVAAVLAFIAAALAALIGVPWTAASTSRVALQRLDRPPSDRGLFKLLALLTPLNLAGCGTPLHLPTLLLSSIALSAAAEGGLSNRDAIHRAMALLSGRWISAMCLFAAALIPQALVLYAMTPPLELLDFSTLDGALRLVGSWEAALLFSVFDASLGVAVYDVLAKPPGRDALAAAFD